MPHDVEACVEVARECALGEASRGVAQYLREHAEHEMDPVVKRALLEKAYKVENGEWRN